MATVKKGVLHTKSEWWKHLRKFGKRRFWHVHRRLERALIRRVSNGEYGCNGAATSLEN